MLTFNTDGMVAQQFPFPAPIMDYVLKNLKPQHLIKLYQCCKFFYVKYRQNIIRNLEVVDDGEEEMFHPNKTTICISNPTLDKLIDFWISDSFIYNSPSNVKLMPSFSHCTIKKLEACDYLRWEEYEVLTKAGTIEELKIGEIYNNDDDLVPVEDVIAAVPNATSFHFTSCKLSPKSFESMVSLDHKAKISNFILENLTTTKNSKPFLIEFLVKNAISDCNIRIDFQMFDYDSDDYDSDDSDSDDIPLQCRMIRALNEISEILGKMLRYDILKALEEKKNLDLKESAAASSLMP